MTSEGGGGAKASATQPKAAKHGNGYDPDKTQDYVARIEALNADIASIMGEAMNECRSIHADIKRIYDEAKDASGIPKKALKRVIAVRKLERKAAEARDELEGEDQDSFDLIRHALGDLAELPLGAAALKRAGAHDDDEQIDLSERTDLDERDLRPRNLRLPDAGRPDLTDPPFAMPPDDNPTMADLPKPPAPPT